MAGNFGFVFRDDWGGFLSAKERADLTALARNGLAEHRVARRANAIFLLDKGGSCEKVAQAVLLDDDTVREWRDLFATRTLKACRGSNWAAAPHF